MTDYNGIIAPYTNADMAGTDIDQPSSSEGVTLFTAFPNTAVEGLAYISYGENASITYYKMRALRDPFGTGFVSWTVTLNPDPNGDEAPEAIVPGSAVIMASWIG